LGALIAFCTILNFSSFLGMIDTATATINDLSLHLTTTYMLLNQPLVRKNYVGDAPVAETDVWCEGCRYQILVTKPSKFTTCGYILPPYNWHNHTQHKLDVQKVIDEYPECSHCLDCSQGLYYRYDTVAPKVKQGHTFYLKSVPAAKRFPTDQINNITKFLSEESDNTTEMLWEFNPSIVILPASVRRRLRNDEYVYLASFRLSSDTYCWDKSAEESLFRPHDDFISYIGLALLRRDLSVIEEGYYSWMRDHSDFYVFVMEDNDEILLTTGNFNIPLYLLPQNESLTGSMKELRKHGSSAGMPQVAIHARHRSCINKAGQLVATFRDKNLNYFVDADNNRLVEYWPMEPHEVDLMGNTITYYKEESLNRSNTVISGNLLEPKPTFGTIDEPFRSRVEKPHAPWGRDRGSACCIKLRGPSMDNVLVGISHVRLQRGSFVFPSWFNASTFIRGELLYLSRFYAFEMTAPYNIVAKSGVFCLGWPSKDERGSSPYQHLGDSFKFIEHFDDCPAVNYVSGMTLKADDPSTAIIAYGINDCTSRMIEIDVSEIKRLLFGLIE
jgi:hypothetical protein